jgi:2',3'-cyclic-nucleotide 2'-phosphodiesterase/3'-nucleotidase
MKTQRSVQIKNPHFLLLFLLSLLFAPPPIKGQAKQNKEDIDPKNIVRLKIVGMTDVHGNLLSYDHLQRRPASGGLPWIYSYMKREREDTTQHVVLLNAGDILQGSMAVYFYNYIDRRPNDSGIYMPARLLSKIGVDASVFGNHDLEPGLVSARRFNTMSSEMSFEVVGANIINKASQRRVFRPYTILERGGLRIAVLGLTTPILTGCARTEIIADVDVLDMLESARYWMNRIQEREAPDLIIGLFHAGFLDRETATEDSVMSACLDANDAIYIAKNIPGFDALILGHNHKLRTDSIYILSEEGDPVEGGSHGDGLIERINNIEGRPVLAVESGYGGKHLGVLDFEVYKIPGEKARILSATAKIEDVVEGIKLPQYILDEFAEEEAIIAEAANEFVAIAKDSIYSTGAFFGSNFFVDIAHKVQLEIGHNIVLNTRNRILDTLPVDVSFASPLSSRVMFILEDSITFGDLLRLYRYENKLVMFRMTGKEIKDYLEYSYGLWINQMHSPADRLLRINTNENNPFLFVTPSFNFDSGAGLDYEVDVRKPAGERITILRMWSGKPYHEDSMYNVVANSFRYSGAGGHLQLGAKISPEELVKNRFIRLYDVQVRELIRRQIIYRQRQEVDAFQYNNWKFVPDDYVLPAKVRDYEELTQRQRW